MLYSWCRAVLADQERALRLCAEQGAPRGPAPALLPPLPVARHGPLLASQQPQLASRPVTSSAECRVVVWIVFVVMSTAKPPPVQPEFVYYKKKEALPLGQFIYNSSNREILGRTGTSWGKPQHIDFHSAHAKKPRCFLNLQLAVPHCPGN